MKILVSACLLGEPIRYDGRANDHKVVNVQAILNDWRAQNLLIPICPETLGGLPTPRAPAEINGGDGHRVLNGSARVITQSADVTNEFMEGAKRTLEIAKRYGATVALLAARSPSCGNKQIYNGEFTGILKQGLGVTAALLEQYGVKCFSPEEFAELQDWVEAQL